MNLAGRKFIIRKQFLDDLKGTSVEFISKIKASVLVMHSPVDATVAIDEAERIYKAAKHPKSFISLGDADHLLTRAVDAEYVAGVISAWATRLTRNEAENARPKVDSGHSWSRRGTANSCKTCSAIRINGWLMNLQK